MTTEDDGDDGERNGERECRASEYVSGDGRVKSERVCLLKCMEQQRTACTAFGE